MNKTKCIWKYPLVITDHQVLTIPHGAKFLSAIEQEDLPTLYFIVNPKAVEGGSFQYLKIVMFGTGQPITNEELENLSFLGTVPTHNGILVWHIFKEGTL